MRVRSAEMRLATATAIGVLIAALSVACGRASAVGRAERLVDAARSGGRRAGPNGPSARGLSQAGVE